MSERGTIIKKLLKMKAYTITPELYKEGPFSKFIEEKYCDVEQDQTMLAFWSNSTVAKWCMVGPRLVRRRLSIKEIRELKENGVDVDTMVSGNLRENLFKKTVDDIFSSGRGEFDEEKIGSSKAEKPSWVVNSLNDLLACNKVVPLTPLSWEVPKELSDLFSVYLKSDPSPENLARVQYLLNISDSTAEALRAMKDRGLQNEAVEEEFVF
ncbi:protein TIC [Forsythia ovata]|uniref:Protein TIC n=1 Tax=Forsythia ovata TaxID=205694 RepID=A0ABD1WL33_9LAMI